MFIRDHTFLLISLFIFISCERQSQLSSDNDDNEYNFIEEDIVLDQNGEVITTTIEIDHFSSSEDCQTCHQQHFEEWGMSMHAHSFHDPIFFNLWSHEKINRPSTATNYCTQCHAPASFVSNYDLSEVNSIGDLDFLPDAIKEGVSCQFCHNTVNTSTDVFTEDNIAAVAEYHLSIDKMVMYGSIQNPEENAYHDSYYSEIYESSGICLPCHSQYIRGMPIEATFQEWNSFPGFSMSDEGSCQSCHMKIQPDGHHDHSFTGVDFHDLTSPVDFSSQEYIKIIDLMESAAELEFIGQSDSLVNQIELNTVLNIPVKIKSFTGHKFPSGTTFSREAWIELKVEDSNQNLIYSSGIINGVEDLDSSDQNLLVFTSWLLDEEGNIINEASNAYDYIDQTLNTMGTRFHNYEVFIENGIEGPLLISARLLFRPFKPSILNDLNPELVPNIPTYEIDSITKEVIISSQ